MGCLLNVPNIPILNIITSSSSNTKPHHHSLRHKNIPPRNRITSFSASSDDFPQDYVTETNDLSKSEGLSNAWREVQGSNNWEGLLEPSLHPLLRREIVRYGEFVAACYDAFDLDPSSKLYLRCKYGKRNMFREVGLENSGYEITKYVYATAPRFPLPIQSTGQSSCERWVGYVAVSMSDRMKEILGRRDLVVVFRGTVTYHEWITNLMSSLTSANLDPHDARPEVKVESGFLGMYTSPESNDKFGVRSCRDQLLSEVSRLLNKYKHEEVSITLAGHSMGSSLALLLAYDIAELQLNTRNDKNNNRNNNSNGDAIIPITVFSFGGPRVGNDGFKERCEELGIRVLRIVNPNDPITRLPGVFFNENFRPWSGSSCYAHLGVELTLESIDMQNPYFAHDMGTYINLLKNPQINSQQVQQSNRVDIGSMNLIARAEELVQFAQNLRVFLWRNLPRKGSEFMDDSRE